MQSIKSIYLIAAMLWLHACSATPTGTETTQSQLSGSGELQTAVTERPQKIDPPATLVTEPKGEQSTPDLSWRTESGEPEDHNLTYPYRPPHADNIAQNVFDGTFETEGEKNVRLEGATLDTTHARSGLHAVKFESANDTVVLDHIPVEEGAWYIVSGYLYAESLPSDIMRYYVEYLHGDQELDIPNYPMVATGAAGQWQEFVLPVYIKKDFNVDHIRLLLRNVGAPDTNRSTIASGNGTLWLDDVTIHRVEGSDALYGMQKPHAKAAFDGALVRVDSLGNFSIKTEEGYNPFLPVIIYPTWKTQKWKAYREKGFNTIVCTSLKEAKEAVKLGMHWIWSLYDYGIYDGDREGYARFEREYRQMRDTQPELFAKLLYFYWDNERYQLFDTVKHFSDTIKKIDVDAAGRRYRPFLMQLDFSTANPHYINDTYQLADLQGLYANPMVFEDNDPQNYQGVEFKGYYDGEFANFAIFEHLPGVKVPKTVFVVNSPFGDKHLANTVFAAFARGGKGFAYWKDGGSQPDVTTKPWWNDFAQTTAKMQQMLPLLRQPHWTSWDLNVSLPDDEEGIVVGKRDFGEKRCMLYASRSNKAERVRFGSDDIEDGRAVIDYFSGQEVAQWHEGAFELSLKPRDYGVCCW